MDVEYARLARDLQLPKGMSAPKANVIENAAASYKSPNASADQVKLKKKNTVFSQLLQLLSYFHVGSRRICFKFSRRRRYGGWRIVLE